MSINEYRNLERRIIFTDEDMVGYSDDIADYIKYELAEVLNNSSYDNDEIKSYCEMTADLLSQLDKYDYELVLCKLNGMDGSYTVYKYSLEKGEN